MFLILILFVFLVVDLDVSGRTGTELIELTNFKMSTLMAMKVFIIKCSRKHQTLAEREIMLVPAILYRKVMPQRLSQITRKAKDGRPYESEIPKENSTLKL